ncbi:hypothetical protein KC686_02585, partial [Candidatus Woesebacteria bacterium]|nr:hypothetical protein [Candidatus Woesebacteria bacterium]
MDEDATSLVLKSPTIVQRPSAPPEYTLTNTGILTPNPKGEGGIVITDSLPDQAEHPPRIGRDHFCQEKTVFISSPLSLFTKELQKLGLPHSFVQELAKQVKEKKSHAKVSRGTESLDEDRERYLAYIINGEEFQLCDATQTIFCKESNSKEQVPNFDKLFGFIFSFLNELTGANVLRFSKTAEVILEAFQIRYSIYRFPMNEHLEQYLYSLQNKSFSPQVAEAVLSLMSRFDIVDTDAAQACIPQFSKKNNCTYHPLYYGTEAAIGSNFFQKYSTPNLGIEIEGHSVVLTNQTSPGFTKGVDGDGKTPEYRRNKEAITLDTNYQFALYELWYLFKMEKFHGQSIHLTLDDPDGRLRHKFTTIMGNDNDSIRKKLKDETTVVELRFNLQHYQQKLGNRPWSDIDNNFFELILGVIDFVDEKNPKFDDETHCWKRHFNYSFWRNHFKQKGVATPLITLENISKLLDNESDSDVRVELVKKMEGGQRLTDISRLIAGERSWFVRVELVKKMEGGQ